MNYKYNPWELTTWSIYTSIQGYKGPNFSVLFWFPYSCAFHHLDSFHNEKGGVCFTSSIHFSFFTYQTLIECLLGARYCANLGELRMRKHICGFYLSMAPDTCGKKEMMVPLDNCWSEGLYRWERCPRVYQLVCVGVLPALPWMHDLSSSQENWPRCREQ